MDLRPLTEDERQTVEEFRRAMEEEVIPEIARDIYEREILAQESRRRIV